ncbi:MAG: branched-chain amino acid ABC transporter permease [Alphaproteobacteria bacterium]|nr:branched-chain amino acid ABC transporter permease [Alphaproteobacteria bacterium]
MASTSRWAGLGALAVFLAVLPQVLPNNYYVDVAVLAGFNAIVCVGLNLLIGYAGQISLGHAGFFGLGAYSSAILVTHYGWPPLAALLAGALLVGLLAFAIARPILKLKGHYLAMATLGIGIIISIIINTEAQITGGPDGIAAGNFTLGGFELKGERAWYWVIAVLLLVTVWLATNLVDSPVGRALRALHGSEVGAEVVGVDTTRYKVLVFVVSAVIASIAGSLFAHYTSQLTPTKADFFKSIELVTMVVFGGMASTFGALVGAAFLTMLPQVLTVFEDYEPIILGGIMMGTMIFMPRGLVPTISAFLTRRRS